MSKQIVLEAVILGYRTLLEERYQYEELQKKYTLPTAFDATRVQQFRTYFLEYVYPHPNKRKALNEAFQDLDNYIKNPEKLLRILIDSGRLIFKYGRHLPKILKAGIKALKSFRTATAFETKLVENAMRFSLQPPYSSATIQYLISTLPQSDIALFIQNNQRLLETLYDRVLVEKIIEIVEYLIAKMKKRPAIYTIAEINALTLGRDLIKEGNLLFHQLTIVEQRQVLDMIVRVERDFISAL